MTRSPLRISLIALSLLAGAACQPQATDEYAMGHATSETQHSGADLRALPVVDGFRTSPPLAAPEQATRVAFLITLADEEASVVGSLEARGRTGAGAVGAWQPVEVTFSEENLRVARAELGLLADAVEVRLDDNIVNDVAELTYAAVRLDEERDVDADGSGDDGDIHLADATGDTQGLDLDLALAGVISREAWGTRRSGNCWTESGKQRMAIHHTASARTASGSRVAMVRALQNYSIDGKGYCDLDYNFLVTDDGQVFEGRPLRFLAAHSGGYNGGNVGIVLVGCFDASSTCNGKGGRDIPDPMLLGAAHIVKTIANKYGIPINADRVKGHGQQPGQYTSCPGSHALPRLDGIRWLASYSGPPAAPTTQVIFDLAGYLPSSAGYAPVGPARLLDSRAPNATHTGPLANDQSIPLAVVGHGGVPSTGVGAVVLNVTVTQPTAPGHLSVYPSGTAFPGTSNLNFGTGQTTANLVIARPGADGNVRIRHHGGAAHVVVDVFGWFPSSSGLHSIAPARVLDTRGGAGDLLGKQLGDVNIKLAGRGGVPSSGVGAVIVNLTVTQPNAAGFATLYEKGRTRPGTSNVNYAAGQTKANLAIVPISSDGYARLFALQRAHFVVDVYGWLPDGADLRMVDAVRLLDTRQSQPLAHDGRLDLQVTGRGGVPASGVGAVFGNLTVTQPTGHGYMQVFPAGGSIPPTSNLNFAPGETVPNAVFAPVGAGGKISIRAHVSP